MRLLTPAIELPTDHALDVYEVADICGCHVATVQREARRGKLRGTKVGSRWRFRPEDVAAYLEGPQPTAEQQRLDDYVAKIATAAPELSQVRRDRLAALLLSGGDA